MVKITNGKRTTIVTHGVFEEVYKPMGWKIKNKKSIRDMTIEELKDFAEINLIDISGINSKKDMIALIEAELTEGF